jgi:Lipopolysaccharide-assembly
VRIAPDPSMRRVPDPKEGRSHEESDIRSSAFGPGRTVGGGGARPGAARRLRLLGPRALFQDGEDRVCAGLPVGKEIERRTPFKHVGTPEGADTILDGTINYADKSLVVQNPFNYPRQLTATINVAVNWTHNPATEDELNRGPTTLSENVNFTPELGETSATAFYRTNQALAKQIVDMMEQAW